MWLWFHWGGDRRLQVWTSVSGWKWIMFKITFQRKNFLFFSQSAGGQSIHSRWRLKLFSLRGTEYTYTYSTPVLLCLGGLPLTYCFSGLSPSYGSCCLWNALLSCRTRPPHSRYLQVRAARLRCHLLLPRTQKQKLLLNQSRSRHPGLSRGLQWKGVWTWYTETSTMSRSFRMYCVCFILRSIRVACSIWFSGQSNHKNKAWVKPATRWHLCVFWATLSSRCVCSLCLPFQGLCSSSWLTSSQTTGIPGLLQLHCKWFWFFRLLSFSLGFVLLDFNFPSLCVCVCVRVGLFLHQHQHVAVVLKPRRLYLGSGRSWNCLHRGQWCLRCDLTTGHLHLILSAVTPH